MCARQDWWNPLFHLVFVDHIRAGNEIANPAGTRAKLGIGTPLAAQVQINGPIVVLDDRIQIAVGRRFKQQIVVIGLIHTFLEVVKK